MAAGPAASPPLRDPQRDPQRLPSPHLLGPAAGAILLAAALLRGLLDGPRGISVSEAGWLAGLPRWMAWWDSWVGSVGDERAVRVPLLVVGAGAAALVLLALRPFAGWIAALGGALAVSLLPCGMLAAGRIGPVAAVQAAAALMLASASGSRGVATALALGAIGALVVDPTIALVAAGMLLGWIAGSTRAGRAALAGATILALGWSWSALG